MKKSFALAFVLAGLLVSAVSCTPIIRATVNAASGAPTAGGASFLGATMLLAFACLCTLIGVLLMARPLAGAGSEPGGRPRRRTTATAVSLSPLLLLLGLPMVHLLVPLWAAWRSRGNDPGLCAASLRLLNFQITWTLFAVVALLLCAALIGVLMLPVLLAFQLAVTLRGAWQTWNGRSATYPLSLELIRPTNSANEDRITP